MDSRGMTWMGHMNTEDGSIVLQMRLFSGAPEWIDSFSDMPEQMDSHAKC